MKHASGGLLAMEMINLMIVESGDEYGEELASYGR